MSTESSRVHAKYLISTAAKQPMIISKTTGGLVIHSKACYHLTRMLGV